MQSTTTVIGDRNVAAGRDVNIKVQSPPLREGLSLYLSPDQVLRLIEMLLTRK